MRWAWGLVLGLGIILAAGVAYACPQEAPCGDRYGPARADHHRYDDADHHRYDDAERYAHETYRAERYDDEVDHGDAYAARARAEPATWVAEDGGFYMYGHRAAQRPCPYRCRETYDGRVGAGEVSLPGAFFADSGGVGPIPDTSYYGGGGYVIVGSGAHASASASARASVSVRFRGGFRGGGCCHGGGGKKGGKH